MSRAVLAALIWTTGTGVAVAAERTPTEVVQHHVKAIKAANIEALMEDYAPDTVIMTPKGMIPGQYPADGPGIFAGEKNARKVMTFLTKDDNIGAVRSMTDTIEPIGDNVALLHWKQFQGTTKEISGEDVFIVKHGKIAMQYLVP